MKAKSAAIMLVAFVITLVPMIVGTAGIAEAVNINEIGSPRIVEDSDQGTGYLTTWDCIYFGEYWQNDTNGDGLCFEKDTTVSRTQVIDSDGDGVYSDEDSSIYGDGRLYTDRDGCYYTELVDGVEKLFQERIVIDALSAAFNPGETSHVFAADSKEPIKWRVLNYDSNTGEALILSDALIEKFDFYSPTWSSNEMRSFLNSYDGAANSNGVDHTSGGFLTNAFSANERADIIQSVVVNADNPVYGTDGGEDTLDWVFCLSIDEAMTGEYGFISNEFIYRTREGQLEGSKFDRSAGDNARAATSTAYVNCKPGYDNSDSWWLRTPGYSSNAVAWVDSGGGVNTPWSYYLKVPAVRPALRINLKASSNWKNAGTIKSNGEQTPAGEETTEPVVPDDTDGVCYKLSFNAQEGIAEYDFKSIEVGKAYGALPKATRSGFTFLGWYTKASGGSKVSASTKLTSEKDVTVYAHWKAHRYNIKFKGNGGSGSMKDMTGLECGKKYTLKANKYSRKGYVFSGWSTSKKGAIRYTNKARIYNATTKDNSAVTLYAVWKKKPASIRYSISYEANGGTGKMSLDKNLAYGKTYKLKKNAFKRSGFTFVGWSLSKGGSIKYWNNEAVRNLTSEDKGTVKLYAVWVKKTDTAKIKKEKKNTPRVYGCIISGCNDRYAGHTLNGATDVYKKLLKNKTDGYTTESKNIKLVGVGQPAPYKHQIDEFIKESFSATTSNDISFVFYAGHGRGGGSNGKGLGICTLDDDWSGYYPYSAFLNLLNEKIKGKIVLIVDACYSGGFVEAAKNSPAKNRICVLAATADNEPSTSTYKARMDTEKFGFLEIPVSEIAAFDDVVKKKDSKYQCFTYTMMKGLSWQKSSNYPADLDKDKVVTCEELYAYINSNMPKSTTQSPKCYLGKLKDQILFG